MPIRPKIPKMAQCPCLGLSVAMAHSDSAESEDENLSAFSRKLEPKNIKQSKVTKQGIKISKSDKTKWSIGSYLLLQLNFCQKSSGQSQAVIKTTFPCRYFNQTKDKSNFFAVWLEAIKKIRGVKKIRISLWFDLFISFIAIIAKNLCFAPGNRIRSGGETRQIFEESLHRRFAGRKRM